MTFGTLRLPATSQPPTSPTRPSTSSPPSLPPPSLPPSLHPLALIPPPPSLRPPPSAPLPPPSPPPLKPPQAAEVCCARIAARGLGHLSLLPQAVDAREVVLGAGEAWEGGVERGGWGGLGRAWEGREGSAKVRYFFFEGERVQDVESQSWNPPFWLLACLWLRFLRPKGSKNGPSAQVPGALGKGSQLLTVHFAAQDAEVLTDEELGECLCRATSCHLWRVCVPLLVALNVAILVR